MACAKSLISGLAALAALLLAGCASAQRDPMAAIDDPFEGANRRTLALNQAVFGPISGAYHAATPSILRQGIGNLSSNFTEPRIFANDLLQLRFGAGATTAGRFLFNSTFGVGGLFDVASISGLKKQSGDFGQTLFVWGVEGGPYLVSPLLGPSNVRDTVGYVVDQVGDPTSWALALTFGNDATIGVGLDFVTQIDQLKQAQDSSIDFYAFLRSAYYQTRRAELREAIGLPVSVETPQDLGPTPPARPAAKARAPRKPPAAANP